MALNKPHRKKNHSEAIWLCLEFPLLGLECHSHYRLDHPAALVHQHKIIAVNAEARDHGLDEGMSAASAEGLCPQLQCYPRHPAQQQQKLELLALWAWQYTPMVVPGEQALLLEVGSCLKLHKGLRALLKQLEKDLLARGYSYRIGLAHTPKAAALAVHLEQPWSHLLSSDYSLDSAALHALLGQLPVHLLQCSAKARQGLEASGLFQLSQLRSLPSASLSRRFGKDFSQYLARFWGQEPDPQALYQPPAEFHQQRFFIEPLNNQQQLMPFITELLEELCRFLTLRQLHCQQLDWRLHFDNKKNKSQTLSIVLASAQNRLDNFIALTELKLSETTLKDAEIHTLILSVDKLEAQQEQANDLFEQSRGKGSLNDLQDRLRIRLGDQAVKQSALRASHIPEFAWQYRDNLSHRLERTGRKADAEQSLPARHKLRPNWLLPRPAPLSIRKGELHWQGKVTLLGRPERIGGYWWQRAVSRDYFIARNDQGALLWVFQNKRNRRWFVQGLFG